MQEATEQIAREIRKAIIKMHQRGPNVGSALSTVDILAVLYFEVMRIQSPNDPARDRFVLSKGHAVSALYAVLAKKDFISEEMLADYLEEGSPLCGHPVKGSVPGIEVSTGSLGHGLPIGAGMALAEKRGAGRFRVFVLMGDGECQEGSVWEAAMLASRWGLDNLVAIIDANGWQGYQRVEAILPVDTLKAKWEAFGWAVQEVDGHDMDSLRSSFRQIPFYKDKPSVIIAHTVKGKGIAVMEDTLEWHYFSVPREKLNPFLKELEK